MKAIFIDTLRQMMREHTDMIVITADMGFSVHEDIQKEFPKRFINTGVTEQASMSIAAGFALSGYKVFFYAQAAFASMRCYEQIRLDVAYNNVDVKIIGSNAGFALNQMGISHFSLEDIGIMRLLPTMTIFSPGDPIEMEWALKQSYKVKGPVYLRYSKLGDEAIHKNSRDFKIGQPICLNRGSDGALFASGGILHMAKNIIHQLKQDNIHIALYSVPTIKPCKIKIILSEAKKTGNIFTLEEHSVLGALGTIVAETIAESRIKTNFVRFGVPDLFTSITGSIDYLLKYNGLSAKKITSRISKIVKR